MTDTKQGQIQDFQGGGGGGGDTTSAEGASFLGGSWGMHPQKCLKICVSKMAIASILRQILHSCNSQFLLDNFDFVQKIQMGEGGGVGEEGIPSLPN